MRRAVLALLLAAVFSFPALPVAADTTTTTSTTPTTSSTTPSPTTSSTTTSSTTTTSTLPFAPRTPTLPTLPFASPTIAPLRLPLLVRTPRSYKSDDAMVRVLQRTLAYWGLPGAVDGWYGPQTERRVRSFQRRMGIPVTGTTTTATWRALGIRPV